MSTVPKAADLIGRALNEYPSYKHLEIARILDNAGLLAPDLPEPDDKCTNGDASWELIGKAVVDSWTDEGGPVVKLSVAGRYFTPTEARELAYALLAAAQWAEKEPS